MNAADDEHAFFRFHLPCHLSQELAVTSIDVTRFQRASKSAQHSTGSRGNHIVQSGCVRLHDLGRIDFVVLGNRTVDAETDRLRLTRQSGDAQRTSLSLNSYFGNVHDLRHVCLLPANGSSTSRNDEPISRVPALWILFEIGHLHVSNYVVSREVDLGIGKEVDSAKSRRLIAEDRTRDHLRALRISLMRFSA